MTSATPPAARSWHRTKIVCTLGPATDQPGVLEQLIHAGMDVARINTSHNDHAAHARRIQQVRELSEQWRQPVGVLVDLPGPKFRVGPLSGSGELILHTGQEISLAAAPAATGPASVPVPHPELLQALRPGESVFLKDGTIELVVETVAADGVTCRVMAGGTVRTRSGINLPQSTLPSLIPTDEDRRHIQFAVEQQAEWIGVSFVQTAEDLGRIRALLPAASAPLLMAKIEKRQALRNLEDIVTKADGVMVARGDLGVETDLAEIPLVQKRIIAVANALARPVVTATQMLESMVEQPHPTRAEVTDVANAVLDGTDGVMLSAESAIGRHPVTAAQTLHRVLRATEAEFGRRMAFDRLQGPFASTHDDPISFAACQLAGRVQAKAIVAAVGALIGAARIVRFRPSVPLIAVASSEKLRRQLVGLWGVCPLLQTGSGSPETQLSLALPWLLERGLAQPGDSIVVASDSTGRGDNLDTLRVIRVSKP
jgi:pyruvate kinase